MLTKCWKWHGKLTHNGYARTTYKNSRKQFVHRMVYEAVVGPIPEGYEIDHLCRVRNCYNPNHLEAVTSQENKKRQGQAKTQCKRQHPLFGENLYLTPDGRRQCKVCGSIRAKNFNSGVKVGG